MTAVSTLRRFLGRHPMVTSVTFVVVGALPLYLTSAQFPALERDIGLTTTTLGVATAVYFGMSAAAATTVGRIVARLGGIMGLRTGALLSAGASLLAVASSWWWFSLIVAISIGGLANTFMQVGTNVVLASQAPMGRQGVAFGAKQSAIPLASMLAGMLMPVVGVAVGWQWPFVLAMVVGLTAAWVAPSQVATESRSPVATDGNSRWKPSPALRWMTFGGAFGGAVGNSLSLFLVPAAVAVGISETSAGSVLAVTGALVLTVRLANGWLADRMRSTGHRGMIVALALGALGCYGLLIDGTFVFLVAITIALMGSWGWQGLGFLAVVRLHPENPARASGVLLSGNLTGNMVGPLVVGYLAGSGTYAWVWVFCGTFSLIASLSMLMSRFRARHMNLLAQL